MTLEAAPGRAVVILSREELMRYGISCAGMSLADKNTRVMLGDILKMLEHMGLLDSPDSAASVRRRVSIECACGSAGGCTLFFILHALGKHTPGDNDLSGNKLSENLPSENMLSENKLSGRMVSEINSSDNGHTAANGNTIRFSGADAVYRAAKAGAFNEDLILTPDGSGYILRLPPDIEWWREGLLREFCEGSGEE